MYQHILIPTDGSELAHKAVVHGLALAKTVGAKVTALTVEPSFNVYDVPPSQMAKMSGAFDEYAEQARKHATRLLNKVADEAKAAGVSCETLQLTHDRPFESIVAAAKDNDCDLIVMASHGRTGIAAVILGSVTTKVLAHTAVPVLICR